MLQSDGRDADGLRLPLPVRVDTLSFLASRLLSTTFSVVGCAAYEACQNLNTCRSLTSRLSLSLARSSVIKMASQSPKSHGYPLIKLPHPFLTTYRVQRNHNSSPMKLHLTKIDQPESGRAPTDPLHDASLSWLELSDPPKEECPPDANNSFWARARRSPQTAFQWSGHTAPSLACFWNVIHAIFLAHPMPEYFRVYLEGKDEETVRHELLGTGLAIEHPRPLLPTNGNLLDVSRELLILRSAFWQGAASPTGPRPIWVVGDDTGGTRQKPLSQYPIMPENFQLTNKIPQEMVYIRHPVRRPKPRPGSMVYSRYVPEVDDHFSLEVVDWQNPTHLEIFNKWQNDPRVAKGWNETGSIEEHRAYLKKLHFDPHVICLFGRFGETLFSYFEIYWSKEDHYGAHYDAGDYDRGRHSLVGDESFRGARRVNAWYSSCIHYCFLDDPRTANVVGEPNASGAIILSYENSQGLTIGKYVDLGHKRSPYTMERQIVVDDAPARPSLFHGPSDAPLWDMGLADFLDQQCLRFGKEEAIITPWNGARWNYHDIQRQSSQLARYMLARGIRASDRVAILAGNRAEYAAVFFACMRIGAILVILNNTYTSAEAKYALQYTESKILFTTATIGQTDNTLMVRCFNKSGVELPNLQQIILLSGSLDDILGYQGALNIGSLLSERDLMEVQKNISPFDTCNLQFTSGSTGNPKAAMLTQHGLLNNSRFIGDRMSLTPADILCCPPPLFHCFGLVLGLLAVITHGAKIVYPAETFDGQAVLRALSDEKCTAVHGVPAMFDILFSLPAPSGFDCRSLRTGIIAGAPVPRYLMELLVNRFGMTEFTSSYGLTEASPTCFNAFVDDDMNRRLSTVGTLMPHASAKVVDAKGRIVPVGTRGELCIAGYQIQPGYWKNDEKSAEAMKRDDDGIVWLHTGDEAFIDHEGYCTITGRFKDIIIRGGENIYPLEIEERLMKHEAIDRAIVIGLPDQRYGEQVSAFLQRSLQVDRPSVDAIRAWTRETLGRHKAPVHVFWLGEDGIPPEIPITGSGKIKKFEMKKLGQLLLNRPRTKL
ncbi:hypothetical protein R9X50_00764600 [Acrodontium crateriforme]|uniref:Acyltransferase MbtK/IucB-like conserved domain-containing protein n=1 Tax=Acrodontium crateriforme TaxID=150365 RepID=A0AAQ3MD26_9PEZI|nr:hypothetical protein R9X50_00764600 [Acrodontium crateriforme]